MFGAVLVTGARQVGKTTLLKEVASEAGYVTLDDKLLLMSAISESGTFFKDNPPPIFVDEVQYAPNLFPQIKIILDKEKRKGQFYLSGSQQFAMMKNVSESLAGRIGILNLPCLSMRELYGISCNTPFLPTGDYFREREKEIAYIAYSDVWEAIHQGGFPELCANPDFDWRMFFAAYVKTYLERDVRDLAQVGDEVKFLQFMTVAASLTGSLLNLASIARDVGISQHTAERWLSILVASNLVYLLPPYRNNITKRTLKTPKLYFLDTGLAAYLTRWTTPDVLKNGAMAGAFFETFVVSEIIKSYANAGILDFPFYFYRDRDGREIDLLIENGGTLYPIEIKKHADPTKSDVRTFSILDKIPGMRRGTGGVVCLYENLITLSGEDKVIPVALL
ncbi:MAG: ATP-binding protein [Clostridiales Family XIII bacterium]|jgi:predicted AAA+ superfamily ATPase|nr:ATP-binding protein [Clostridiales Family XIII bacterium]